MARTVFFLCILLAFRLPGDESAEAWSGIKDKLLIIRNSKGLAPAAAVKFDKILFAVANQSAIWSDQRFRITRLSGEDVPYSDIEISSDRRGLARIKIAADIPSFGIAANDSKLYSGSASACSITENGIVLINPASLKSGSVSVKTSNPDYVPKENTKSTPAVLPGDAARPQPANFRKSSICRFSDFDNAAIISKTGVLAGFLSASGIAKGQFQLFELDASMQWMPIKAQEFFAMGREIDGIKDFIPRYLKATDAFFSKKYQMLEIGADMPKEMAAWFAFHNEHVKDLPFKSGDRIDKGYSLEGLGEGTVDVQNKRLEIENRLAAFASSSLKLAENIRDNSSSKYMKFEAKAILNELSKIAGQMQSKSTPQKIPDKYQPDKNEIELKASALKPIIDDGKPKLGKISVSSKDYFAKGNNPAWREKGRILGATKADFQKFRGILLGGDGKEIKTDEADKQKDGTTAFEFWLLPGKYTIRVAAKGFETIEIKNIEVKTDNDYKIILGFIKPELE